jgi:hypothetical protein
MNYCVKDLNGNIQPNGDGNNLFAKREDAKKLRNRLRDGGLVCVVSRSENHPRGESVPASNCLNTERTSRRKGVRNPRKPRPAKVEA